MRPTLFLSALALASTAIASLSTNTSNPSSTNDNYNDVFSTATRTPAYRYNSIASILQVFAGSLPPAYFDAIQAALARVPISGGQGEVVALRAAFAAASFAFLGQNGAQQGGSYGSLGTAVDQIQKCLDAAYQPFNPNAELAIGICLQNIRVTFLTMQTGANTILEQFVGTIPGVTYQNLVAAQNSFFSSQVTFPGYQGVLAEFNLATQSVIDSVGPNIVTAIEAFQQCFSDSLRSSTPQTYACVFVANSSPLTSIKTVVASILQQYVGSLSPLVLLQIQSTVGYYFAIPSTTPSYALTALISNAIFTITNAAGANAATAGLQLQYCISAAILSPNPASYSCFTDRANNQPGPLYTTVVLIDNILEVALRDLPPQLVLNMEAQLAPLIANARPAVVPLAANIALQRALVLSQTGPKFVNCFEATKDCIMAVISAPPAISAAGGANCPIPLSACSGLLYA